MKLGKIALGLTAIFGLLWLLLANRTSQKSDSGVIEISYMDRGGPISSALDDSIREFERLSREAHQKDPSKPIYRVISGQTASSDQTGDPTRFLVSVAGGMPPDVISFDRYAVSEWAARGAFTPLDPFLQKDLKAGRPDAIHPEDFYKSAWNEANYTDPISHKRGLYGIPYSMDDRALFYNKDLLKRAGYVDSRGEARPPQTWDELKAMALKMTERDDSGHLVRLGFVPNVGDSWLYLYGWMNGGEFMSADGKTCTLNDPKIVSALGWMTSIYDELGGAKDIAAFESTFQSNDLDAFITGKVAMKIDGIWMLDSMAQYAKHLNWGVATLPMPASEIAKGRKTMSWMGGWCYAIPSTAKHKEAAWELIRFLSTPRAAQILCESARLTALSQGRSFVPVQHPNIKINEWQSKHYVYDDPATDPKVRHAMEVFNSLLNVSRYRPVTMVGQLLWTEHITATDNAVFHKMSPQQALDQATMVVQRQLDELLQKPTGLPLKWSWFVAPYLGVIILLGIFVYLWDTRYELRKKVAMSLRHFGGANLVNWGGDVDGMHSTFFRSQWKQGWLLASPWIIGFVFLTGGPIVFSILISFCRYDVLNPPRFIGFQNYFLMFCKDPTFWKSLGNTLYMMGGIPLGMAMSLAMALLVKQGLQGTTLWKSLFYLPSIIPAVASSILWMWILNPQSGLLNTVLASIGIAGPNWLQDERTSKMALIIMGLWGSGGGMIIWLAGLKGISESYYEAAALDGADVLEQFFYITMPMLSPYIFFNLIIGLIETFQIFTPAYIITKGGPVDSTLFFVYYLFNNAFRYLHMGYAAAAAWFLFLILFGLTLIQLKFSKRWVYYESD